MARTRKVAIVTGAAHGIGRAIARRLLDDGWGVGVVDRQTSELSQAFGRSPSATRIAGDVSDPNVVARSVNETLARFGRIDGIVSNAGFMIRKPIAKLTLDEWRQVIDTNLTATFLFARAAEKALRKTKGAIVAMASTRALMSEANTESYSASKGGLVALTHALSISLAPHVRVNAVSPGWIATKDVDKLRRKDHAQHPAGRVGRPDDIAEIVAYLLDGERAGFITGANFVVDGGMTRKMIYEE
jgi:NAD(P)-dependent dehydrogenase (short-subunit alcohol dehydrogenase family)